ncbi:MAG: STAS domain-containing protein [Actinomycetota bacterium]
MDEALDVEVISAGGRLVVRPTGDLDLESAKRFEDALGDAVDGHRSLIVDLRMVEFLDSEGLSALLRASDRATERGVTFRVVRGPRRVDRIFDLTGTRSRLDFIDLPAGVGLETPHRSVG